MESRSHHTNRQALFFAMGKTFTLITETPTAQPTPTPCRLLIILVSKYSTAHSFSPPRAPVWLRLSSSVGNPAVCVSWLVGSQKHLVNFSKIEYLKGPVHSFFLIYLVSVIDISASKVDVNGNLFALLTTLLSSPLYLTDKCPSRNNVPVHYQVRLDSWPQRSLDPQNMMSTVLTATF